MKITLLTLFPEQFDGFLGTSIIKKAILQELVEVEVVNIRDYTLDKHNRVDDYPFGGGAGLVMKCQPIMDAIKAVRTESSWVIYLGPAGPTFNQNKAKELATSIEHLILLCGHYEGIDERILSVVDETISIGDYILTGGELAAMVVSDAIIRLQKGVITDESTIEESFENDLLEYPQYTFPRSYEGMDVPEVLLSGHHENIRLYRLKEALRKTYLIRPDLLEGKELSKEEKQFLNEIKREEIEK